MRASVHSSMSRLVVISNRVPLPSEHSAGGLASGMLSALRECGGMETGKKCHLPESMFDHVVPLSGGWHKSYNESWPSRR